MKKILPGIVVILLVLIALPSHAQWTLVWADEFEEEIGPDWRFFIGPAWNNELQYYRQENATVEDGNLVITAQMEEIGGKNYTSARLITQNRASWKYGRLEARIKLPAKQGSWPAFWTLGDIGQWPSNGEIDILEHVNTTNIVHANVHWRRNGNHTMREGRTTGDVTEYNIYAIEWTPASIKWFFNDLQYHEVSILNSVMETQAFHQKHHFIVNMAVGGDMPGFTIDEESMPWKMYVDYVRVYTDTTLVLASNVSIQAESDTLVVNTTSQLTATVLPDTATYATVSWSSGNTAVATVNSAGVVTARTPGSVTITARNANLVATRNLIIVPVTTSINNEQIIPSIRIYPNPVTDGVLKVELDELPEVSLLRILDLHGKVLKERRVDNISTQELHFQKSPGVYILQIVSGGNVYNRRFSVIQ